ncbi:MAG: hypothetical protein J0H83_04985 [Candidatus Melainabacteria bacterium]|nr:hypothetical protein [Candidatus Melainabacteria bacterium]MBX9671907.1 hypothetical protein [Candidatus Obscuribacterales bacterium]
MLGFIFAVYWLMFAPPPAEAYFDLSTGAYLVQMIFGFLAAFWLSFRNTLFKKKPKKSQDEKAGDSAEAAEPSTGAGHAES